MMGIHASELYTGPSYKFRGAIPFILFPGDGVATGLRFTSTSGDFVLSAPVPSGIVYTQSFGYFAANQINGLNPAGWYYVEMTSTTIGRVWNNRYITGNPSQHIPGAAARVGFVTQQNYVITATADVSIAGPDALIPGNCLGKNGGGSIEAMWSYTSSAAQKTLSIMYGGTSLCVQAVTASVNHRQLVTIGMRGDTKSCVSTNWVGVTSSTTNGILQRTVDTELPQQLTYIFRAASAADIVVLEMYACILYMGV